MKVGIIGAGQLAKMLIEETNSFFFRINKVPPKFYIFDEKESCASHLGEFEIVDFKNLERVETLKELDFISYEFENIPAESLKFLESTGILRPGSKSLEISQSRVHEKSFFENLGLKIGKVFPVNKTNYFDLNIPNGEYFLKTDRLGYDGKGQRKVRNQTELVIKFKELGEVDCILEEKINFQRELSIVGTRDHKGNVVFYPLSENHHQNGILMWARPAFLNQLDNSHTAIESRAKEIWMKVANNLEYIGTLCLELFQVDNDLFINEMAPRVHNSTHWTIEACEGSQFLNHIKSVINFDLVETQIIKPTQIFNVLGKWMSEQCRSEIKDLGAVIHDYGKAERKGRKIGHISITKIEDEDMEAFERKLDIINNIVGRSNYF